MNASRLGILFVGFICMSLVALATLSGNFPLVHGVAVICGAGLVTMGREAGFSPETTLWHCVSYEGTSVNAFDSLIAADSSNGQVLLWERDHGQWVGSASQTRSQIEGDHLEVHANDPEYRMKHLKERRMPMLRNCSRDVLVTWYDRLRILSEQA